MNLHLLFLHCFFITNAVGLGPEKVSSAVVVVIVSITFTFLFAQYLLAAIQ